MRLYNMQSNVEKVFLEKNKESNNIFNKDGKIFTLQFSDTEELGKITALRFLEWLQINFGGVISLPTGRTPKTFIEHTINFLNNWDSTKVQKELKKWGLNPSNKPDMKTFYFVQLDEFFPINPKDKKSFIYFINEFYINGFGLDRNKCLLMNVCYDNSINADNFIKSYEEKIKELGGIGFFLGGIGPDGHVAFNIAGSDHKSKTRFLSINYQTAAAAAGSFGGIENVRDKTVITIGLQTITQNEATTAIIIASGQSKAKVVKEAIENEPSKLYPATALQKLKNSRFYITNDAASLLERNKKNIKINADDLKNKIKTDLSEFNKKKILHTSPHHDDVFLGYFPLIDQLVKQTNNYCCSNCKHHFAIVTSGYHAISDDYLKKEKKLKTLFGLTKEEINNLKSDLREKEEEKMWSHLGFTKNDITHLRLPFYETTKIDFDKDVKPVINLINDFDPDFITVCMDPEGIGPVTHFKVLQIVKMAVKEYLKNNLNKKLKIIGYRNVWSKFNLNEANFIVPVSQNELDNLKKYFKESYKSQIKASFPHVEYDEPFDDIVCNIMQEQYKEVEKILGADFFETNENEKLKNTIGFCFLKMIEPKLF